MPPRLFTWIELSELRHKWNAHVAYEGKVYDVSSFISRHPGGVEQILSGAGRDITQVFKSYHKSDTFERVLSKYYVGDLIDNEHPVFIKESEFNKLLKQRVAKYLKTHNLDPKIDYRMFCIYFIQILFYFLLLYLPIFCGYNLLYSFALSVLRGFMTTSSLSLGHDAGHFSVTHNLWVWRCCKFVASCALGISSCVWHYRHVIGHHIYANIEGADPDTENSAKSMEIFRIDEARPWKKRYIYQHLYVPIAYLLGMILLKLGDYESVSTLSINTIRMNPLTSTEKFEFWLSKLGHLIIHFVIPLYFLPLTHVIFLILTFELTTSFTYIHLTQITHITEEVTWPKPDKITKLVQQDWAELQVTTAQDYCTDSLFWTLFSGALNHQTAHHLFPDFVPLHYYWITPIIKQTCADMNIKYNSADSIGHALRLHYSFLRKMGKE